MLMLRLFGLLLLQGISIPAPVGYVNDFANIISSASSARMSAIIADVKAKSGGEIVVVTLPDLKGQDVADVARTIGRQWKVGATGGGGSRAKNAGVIILLVPKATSSDGGGHVRIETGYGAEGFLTDATTGAIQDEALGKLGAGDYSGGLELITTRVAQRYAQEFNFTLDSATAIPVQTRVRRPSRSSGQIPPVVYLFIFMFVLSLFGRRRGGGCLPLLFLGGGRGFGGGGFGGGGGFSGGGFGGFGGG